MVRCCWTPAADAGSRDGSIRTTGTTAVPTPIRRGRKVGQDASLRPPRWWRPPAEFGGGIECACCNVPVTEDSTGANPSREGVPVRAQRVRRRGEWEATVACVVDVGEESAHSRLHGDRWVEHGDRCVECHYARAVLPRRGMGDPRIARRVAAHSAPVSEASLAPSRSAPSPDAAAAPLLLPRCLRCPSAARTRRSSGESAADRHRHDCDATRSEGDRESDGPSSYARRDHVSTASPRAVLSAR